MQEEVLSRRLLVFVGNQVFFRCRKGGGDIIEDLNMPGAPVCQWGGSSSLFTELIGENGGIDDLQYLLSYYVCRSLGQESDILRAAQGMLRQWMSANKIQMIEGLPCPLDGSLPFQIHPKHPGGASLTRRQGFPSYSWTGWHGCIVWDLAAGRSWLDLETWIQWHARDVTGTFSIDLQGNKIAGVYPSSSVSLQHSHPLFNDYDIALEESPADDLWTSINYPVIVFWTVCIDLKIIEWHHNAGYGACGRGKEICGSITPDIPTFEMEQNCFCALITGYPRARFMALLLTKMPHGGMERWGIASLSENCLALSLSRPRWEKIYLI